MEKKQVSCSHQTLIFDRQKVEEKQRKVEQLLWE